MFSRTAMSPICRCPGGHICCSALPAISSSEAAHQPLRTVSIGAHSWQDIDPCSGHFDCTIVQSNTGRLATCSHSPAWSRKSSESCLLTVGGVGLMHIRRGKRLVAEVQIAGKWSQTVHSQAFGGRRALEPFTVMAATIVPIQQHRSAPLTSFWRLYCM